MLGTDVSEPDWKTTISRPSPGEAGHRRNRADTQAEREDEETTDQSRGGRHASSDPQEDSSDRKAGSENVLHWTHTCEQGDCHAVSQGSVEADRIQGGPRYGLLRLLCFFGHVDCTVKPSERPNAGEKAKIPGNVIVGPSR